MGRRGGTVKAQDSPRIRAEEGRERSSSLYFSAFPTVCLGLHASVPIFRIDIHVHMSLPTCVGSSRLSGKFRPCSGKDVRCPVCHEDAPRATETGGSSSALWGDSQNGEDSGRPGSRSQGWTHISVRLGLCPECCRQGRHVLRWPPGLGTGGAAGPSGWEACTYTSVPSNQYWRPWASF